jgi:hypothetical protein
MNKSEYSIAINTMKSVISDANMLLALFAYKSDAMLENPTNHIRATTTSEQIIKDMNSIHKMLESITQKEMDI